MRKLKASQIGKRLPQIGNTARRSSTVKARPQPPREIEELDPAVSSQIAADAEHYLNAVSGDAGFRDMEDEQKVEWLSGRVKRFHDMSRAQKVRALSNAYAFYALVKRRRGLQDAVARAADKVGRPISARRSLLRVIVELHRGYGDGEGQDAVVRAGKLYSRDVTIITNFMARGVLPSQVVALSQEKGEGLDSWGRRESVREPAGVGVDRPEPVLVQPSPTKPTVTSHPVSEVPAGKAAVPDLKFECDSFRNEIVWFKKARGRRIEETRVELGKSKHNWLMKLFEELREEAEG